MEPIQNGAGLDPAPETTETEHASAFLERAAERAGVSLADQQAETAEGVETPNLPPQDTEPQRQPDRSRAHEEFQNRQRRREAEAERRAERRLLERLAERFSADPAPPAPAAQAAQDDPEPDMVEDYQGWVAWDRRRQRKEYEEMLDARLKPILSAHEQQQAWAQEQQRVHSEQARRNAWYQEQAALGREATEIYVSTPEGQGFGERLAWRFGHPGDPARGLEPLDGSMTRGLVAAGIPLDKARSLTRANVHALQRFALDNQLNPAAFIDAIIRSEIADYAAAVGAQPVAQAQPTPRRETAAARQVRQLRQTAASAGSVAGTAAEISRQVGPRSAADLARAGEVTVDAVVELAHARYKGDKVAAARALRAEAAKLQQGAGR